MAYSVSIEPAAQKAVAKLPKPIRLKIADRLELLADNPRPHGSIKLTGEDAYRIREGDFRIIYTIQDEQLIVLVIDVGNRRDVYRRR